MSSGLNMLGLLAAAAAASSSSREGDGRVAGEAKPLLTAAETIEALKAAAQRYAEPVPFQVGDLVTPRTDSALKGAGQPSVVLWVSGDYECCLIPGENNDPDSPSFGQRLDMRIATPCSCGHGELRPYWVESWMFEPYVTPEQPQPAAEAPASAA